MTTTDKELKRMLRGRYKPQTRKQKWSYSLNMFIRDE